MERNDSLPKYIKVGKEKVSTKDQSLNNFYFPATPGHCLKFNISSSTVEEVAANPDRHGILEAKNNHTIYSSWFGVLAWKVPEGYAMGVSVANADSNYETLLHVNEVPGL